MNVLIKEESLIPLDFWYANLGRHLFGHAKSVQDAVSTALSQNYLHATKSSSLRLGSGKAASLVMDGSAILMADIRLPHDPPPSLKLMPGEWRTIPNWMAEIIMNPPEPEFMFVVYGKNPGIQDKMRLNVSKDVVEICGAQQLRCRPSVVRDTLAVIGDMSPTVWRKAAFLADQFNRDFRSRTRITAELDKLSDKHPRLEDVLDALPPFGSGDYEAVTLVHAVGMKNAVRSADEALKKAA